MLAAVITENRLISCCSYCTNEENIFVVRETSVWTSFPPLYSYQMGNKSNQVKEGSDSENRALSQADALLAQHHSSHIDHRQMTLQLSDRQLGSEVTALIVWALFSHLSDAAGCDWCHLVVTCQTPSKHLDV